MNTRSSQWPRTLTSGPLTGRTFWSDKAYKLALGAARLQCRAQDAARARLEDLLAAQDAATAAERHAAEVRSEVDRLLDETAVHFAERSTH